MPRRASRRARGGLAVAGVALGIGLWLTYEWVTLPDPATLLTRAPETTALMTARADEARAQGRKPRRRQQWVTLGAISPYLVNAVLISEDAAFYQHHGVDTDELQKALEEAARKRSLGRGASTITQQLAKNLWLSQDRSLLRKLKELVLARRLEATLGKQRILALYLNVVEWGDGVYGAEAGALEHFGVRASGLSLPQAAILAAMLPAPRRWTVAAHPPVLRTRAQRIVEKLLAVRRVSPDEAEAARVEIDRLLGGAHQEPDVEEDPAGD